MKEICLAESAVIRSVMNQRMAKKSPLTKRCYTRPRRLTAKWATVATVGRNSKPLPYRAKGPLLSAGELAFFRALLCAVGREYFIGVKVRLADIVTCPDDDWQSGYGHFIARQHIDFVLCDPRTAEIRLAIELDDRTHRRKSRQERDRFVNRVLAVARIPFCRFMACRRYEPSQLRKSLLSVEHLFAGK